MPTRSSIALASKGWELAANQSHQGEGFRAPPEVLTKPASIQVLIAPIASGPSAKPQTGREFLRRWRAALQGFRREASPVPPPLGGQFYTDSGRPMGAHLF